MGLPGGVLTAGYTHAGQFMNDVTGGSNYGVKAGGDFTLLIGIIVPVVPADLHRFEIQFDAGVKTAAGDDHGQENKIHFDRYLIELVHFYRDTQEGFRFGYGATYHVGGRLIGDGQYSWINTDFDDALGWTISFDKIYLDKYVDAGFAIGFKYDQIRYHSTRFKADIDGSGLMITLSALTF